MHRLFILLSVIFLTSCGSILSPMKVSSVSTYTMTNSPANTVFSNHTASSKTLLVTLPNASPGYQSSRMIFVMVPYQLRSFSNHRWVAAPAELLMPLIASRLRAEHYFHAVVTSPFSGTANDQLTIQLLTLQQEFLQPQSQVRLSLEVTLQNVATGRVIANRLFQVVVPTTENTPYGGVLATNAAVHQVLDQIATFVVKRVMSEDQ